MKPFFEAQQNPPKSLNSVLSRSQKKLNIFVGLFLFLSFFFNSSIYTDLKESLVFFNI